MKKPLLILILILSFHGLAMAFTDIELFPHYAESIVNLEAKGILKKAELFFPQKELSRIEFVHMMYLSGIFPKECQYAPIRFSDTQLNQWYTPSLLAGVLCGGIRGDKNNAFRPNDTINYAEAAVLLFKTSSSSYQTASDPWYKIGISFLNNSKISLKENPGPETYLTRAQGAYLLDQVLMQQSTAFTGKKLVESARKQKGVVTSYNTGYYAGGLPPENTGACTDVIERAIRELGYDWKGKIDQHMKNNPNLYSSQYDANINYRRVRNVKIYLDHNSMTLSLDSEYLPGDIVTYDQMPGSLWHIAIVSNLKASDGTPLLIHNYGGGVREDNLLNLWPAPKTGHYRLNL